MKYQAFILLALVTVFTFSCQGGIADNSSARTVDPAPSVTPPAINTNQKMPNTECKTCTFDYASYKGELNRQEIEGLLLALNDEYMAIAIYEQVNRDFSDPRPFVNIIRAEITHADMLKGLFSKYGLAIPANAWPGSVPKYSSVAEACAEGVKAEIANRDLYSRLFKTTERQDITTVYKALQRASDENHLPAFQCCGGGGGGRGPRPRGTE